MRFQSSDFNSWFKINKVLDKDGSSNLKKKKKNRNRACLHRGAVAGDRSAVRRKARAASLEISSNSQPFGRGKSTIFRFFYWRSFFIPFPIKNGCWTYPFPIKTWLNVVDVECCWTYPCCFALVVWCIPNGFYRDSTCAVRTFWAPVAHSLEDCLAAARLLPNHTATPEGHPWADLYNCFTYIYCN